jgi:glycosyltransferase involved in cell wall biosynthesis
MHAELVGREWVKKHDLTVFAPILESATDWYHKIIDKKDEEFVIRGYEQPERIGKGGWIDERLWKEDFDVLVIQGLELMPIPNLLRRFPKLSAKKVLIVHEGKLPRYEDFYKLNFDAIVCFDFRYKNMLKVKYPEEKIHIIPFPCYPIVKIKGDKKSVRSELGIPQDKTVLFSFGRQPLVEYTDYLWLADELKKKYDLKYLIVRSDGDIPFERDFLEVRQCRPKNEEIYKYLHASDIFLLPKGEMKSDAIVVSSTVFQCLGALTPIVIPDLRHVELLDKEVLKYKSRNDLKEKVTKVLEDEDFRGEVLKAAKRYVSQNSCKRIADELIKLFFNPHKKIKKEKML